MENQENIEPNVLVQKKFSKSNLKGRVYTICIDGSEHAEGAFNIVKNNFLTKDDSLIAIYIYNSKKDDYYNYRNKKETIIQNYENLISYLDPNKSYFKTEDRVSSIHVLEQVNRIAYEHKADYLFCGFFGMKGPKGDNNELTTGIDYLLRSASEPFIIIKDITERQNKKNSKFNWLFVFNQAYKNSSFILDKFLPLVEIEKDTVNGLSLIPYWITSDNVEKEFKEKMKSNEIQNYSYESKKYETNASSIVNKIVNFGDINYDFVVIFNNKQKYQAESNTSDNTQILLKSKANICVLNE